MLIRFNNSRQSFLRCCCTHIRKQEVLIDSEKMTVFVCLDWSSKFQSTMCVTLLQSDVEESGEDAQRSGIYRLLFVTRLVKWRMKAILVWQMPRCGSCIAKSVRGFLQLNVIDRCTAQSLNPWFLESVVATGVERSGLLVEGQQVILGYSNWRECSRFQSHSNGRILLSDSDLFTVIATGTIEVEMEQ